MHAVVVRVTVDDAERAREELDAHGRSKRVAGARFRCGLWTRSNDTGLSMIVLDAGDAARQMADRVPRSGTLSDRRDCGRRPSA